MYDEDGYSIPKYPQLIKDAQIEIARRFAEGVALDADLERGGKVKREKVGEIEVEYMDNAPGKIETPQIREMLSYLQKPGNEMILG
jgi:hypothetical protein